MNLSSFFKMTDVMKIGQRLGKKKVGVRVRGADVGRRGRHSRALWSLGLL